MNANTMKALHVGPITDAEVTFGDLTVLVGPQATGKSVFLQFLKLLVDSGAGSRRSTARRISRLKSASA